MTMLTKSVLTLVLTAAAIDTAFAAPAVPTLDEASTPVIYLYEEPSGRVFTLDVVENDQGLITGARERDVSASEIAALESAGVEISYVDATPAPPGSRAENGGIVGLPTLPPFFSIVQYQNFVYGNFFVTGARPAGKTKQWFASGFISDHMAEYGTHMGIGLLSDTQQLTEPFPPTYAPAAVGNGIIIGNVSGTPNGCGFDENTTPAYNMETESFWNGGNRLYPQTCSPQGLADRTPYVLEIDADTAGNVDYAVTGGMTWLAPNVDTSPDRPAGSAGTLDAGGLFFALVPVPGNGDIVTLNFIGAQTGWF